MCHCRSSAAPLVLSVLLIGSLIAREAGAIPRRPRLSPFGEDAPRGAVMPVRWQGDGHHVAQATPPAPEPRPATKQPGRLGSPCTADDQCGRGTYCDEELGACAKIRRHINVLYMFYRSRDRRFTEIMGIYWHRSGQAGYRVIFPLYWSFWSPERSTRAVVPFYFDHRRQGARTVVVPPVQYSRSKDRTSVRVWPLLFYSRHSDGDSSFTLVPLLHRGRRGDRSLTVLPLLASFVRRDPSTGLSQGLIGGSVYWRRQGDHRSLAVLPLFYTRTSRERSFAWAAPLTFYRRSGQRRTVASFPLFFHRQGPTSSTTVATVPPLYHHRSEGRRRLYLPPLFGYHRTGEQRTVAVGSAYAHWGPERTAFGLAPLLFAGWSGPWRHLVIFPALWHFKSPNSTTTVAGPVYHRRAGERLWAGLAPLAFYHRSKNYVGLKVLPLFAYSSRHNGTLHRVLSPLGIFRRDTDPERAAPRTDLALFAPPYWHHRSARWSVDLAPPFFGHWHNRRTDSRTTMLGPLPTFLYRRGDRNAQVVFPLFWRFASPTRTTILVGTAYYRRTSTRLYAGLAPVFYYKKKPGYRSITALPLFRYTSADAPGRRRLISPAFFYEHHRERALTHWWTLAPFYYHRRGPRWEVDAMPPLFARWRDREEQKSTLVGGPLILHRGKDSDAQVLFPVFWRFHDHATKTRTAVVFPVLFHRREADGGTTTVAGPTYLRRKPDAWHAGVLPLIYFGQSNDRKRRHAVVFPALWHFERGKRAFTLAGPLLHRSTARRRTVAALPLAFASWDRQQPGQRHRLGLLPAFYYSRRPHGRLLVTPLFGFHKRPTSLWWYAAPYLAYSSRRSRLDMLLPLGFFHRDRVAGRTTVFAMPGYFGRWSKGSSTHVAFPVAWFSRRPARSTSVVFPAYWDHHRRGLSRTTAVVPFYLRHHDQVRGTTSHLALPVWTRRHAHGTDAVVFPLVWHFTGQRRVSTVAFPLYWRFSRAHRDTRVVFPVYWDFARGSRRTTVAVNTIYIRDKVKKTYDFHFLPLVRVQRKRPADFKISFLAGLFGYERIGANRFLKLLLIPIELKRKSTSGSKVARTRYERITEI